MSSSSCASKALPKVARSHRSCRSFEMSRDGVLEFQFEAEAEAEADEEELLQPPPAAPAGAAGARAEAEGEAELPVWPF